MKYFRMSYEEVVFKRSYLNLILLNAAIPGTKPVKKPNDSESDSEMNANNFFLNMM